MTVKRNRQISVFKDRLREIMRDTQTTQAALAAVLQTNPQSISQYVTGQSEPSFSRLKEIADYFEVSVDWLIGTSDDRKRMPSVTDDYGLSTAACEQLLEYRYYFATSQGSSFMDHVNALLSSRYFPKFINSIHEIIAAYKNSTFLRKHPEALPEWVNSFNIPEEPETARVRYLYLLNNPEFAISVQKVELYENIRKLIDDIVPFDTLELELAKARYEGSKKNGHDADFPLKPYFPTILPDIQMLKNLDMKENPHVDDRTP